MVDLSPAVRAVLDAATQELWASNGLNSEARCAAGALRAAVEQLLPWEDEPRGSRIAWKQRLLTRAQLLAIASELR